MNATHPPAHRGKTVRAKPHEEIHTRSSLAVHPVYDNNNRNEIFYRVPTRVECVPVDRFFFF